VKNKDAGIWAVRSAPDSHDDVIGIHDNKFTGRRHRDRRRQYFVLVESQRLSFNARGATYTWSAQGGDPGEPHPWRSLDGHRRREPPSCAVI